MEEAGGSATKSLRQLHLIAKGILIDCLEKGNKDGRILLLDHLDEKSVTPQLNGVEKNHLSSDKINS